MYNYLRRRKRVLVSAAAAVGAAAAVYYFWPRADEPDAQSDDQATARDSAGEQQQQQGDGNHGGDDSSLDASMASHFAFIQEVSTPQELEQLLPRVQAVIYEMTDVQAALAALPPGSPARAKLGVLAQHSLGRALACVWLLPAVDLLVRAKLNLVGRHLFLQERLSQLPAWAVQEEEWYGHARHPSRRDALPPRIHAAAIQAFLPCDHLADTGCRWLVGQVLTAVGTSLAAVDLGAERDPDGLVQLLQALHGHVAANLPTTTGSSQPGAAASVDWPTLLLGPQGTLGHWGHSSDLLPGSSYLPDAESGAMLEELQQELLVALASPQFQQAMQAAVQHAFRVLAQHVVDAFPAPDPAAAGVEAPAASGAAAASREADAAAAAAAVAMQLGVQPAVLHEAGDHATGSSKQPRTWWGYLRSFWGSEPTSHAGQHSMHAAGPMEMQALHGSHSASNGKGSRPTARLLRPVQLAADPMFVDVVQLSKGIASLGPVMALSASIFARPVP